MLAASALMAAGFLAAQTNPEQPSGSSAPTSPTVKPAANPAPVSPPSETPDLTFKPDPSVEPQTPATKPAPKVSNPSPSGGAPLVNAPAAGAPTRRSATAPAADAVKNPAQTADLPPYVLGPNDVIGVAVFGEPNVSGTYAIGPDGRISMPLVGDFKAIGMTGHQLGDIISKKLEEFILDPVVNVQILRVNSKKYTLIGGVGRTGPYPLQQQTTVLDALAAAGGFKDFSNEKKIVIMRGTKKFPFNYKDVIHGKHMEQNIYLEDGDLIIVPE
jgi:polysaccharide export outer membrane protein